MSIFNIYKERFFKRHFEQAIEQYLYYISKQITNIFKTTNLSILFKQLWKTTF